MQARTAIVLLLLVLRSSIPTAYGSRQGDPRPSIIGLVAFESHEPVVSAEVTLWAGINGKLETTQTDANGQFVFRGLRPGLYQVRASKDDCCAPLEFGSSTPILVSGDDATAASIRLVLERAAVITGAIVRPDGVPLQDASVAIAQSSIASNGTRMLTPVAASKTDDRGVYRFGSLPAGRFLLWVTPIESATRDGVAYAETYYPSATTAADADGVVVLTGEVRTGTDIVVRTVPTAQIEGRVVDPFMTRHKLSVSDLELRRLRPDGAASRGRVAIEVSGDGFTLRNVHPGQYQLRARYGAGAPPVQQLSAPVMLSVAGSDIRNVILSLLPSMAVRGRLTTNDVGPPPDFSAIRVSLVPISPHPSGFAVGELVRADGSFTIDVLSQGPYRFVVQATPTSADGPEGWFSDAVLVGDRNVVDSVIEIGGDLSDVRIGLTKRFGRISGALKGSADDLNRYTVIAYPDDSSLWSVPSRRLRAVRPFHNGRFTLSGLPQGRYRLVVVADVERNAWLAPGFFEAISAGFVLVTVADGRSSVQDLVVLQPARAPAYGDSRDRRRASVDRRGKPRG